MRKIILLSIAYFVVNVNLAAQITALFSVDMTEGCEPLVVQFADASSSNGTIISWAWDFDDGSTDDVPNSLHTFAGPGTSYNVCLTVTDDLAQMDTYCMTISVLDNPIAEAGPNVVLTCAEFVVELSAAGSSTGPEIAYEWRDPNGDIIGFDFTVNVTGPGGYTLIVTNTNTGCTASDIVLTLEDIVPPIAEIVANPFCEFPMTLHIGNSSSGPNFTYEWFDAANTLISTSEEVEISNAGIYTLVITNVNNGCTSSSNFEVVEPIPLIVTIGLIDPVLCAGDCSAVLLAEANGGCGNYEYIWSNGTTGPENNFLCGGELHSVTVTDCNGCTELLDYLIPDAPLPLELNYSTTCATSANDGSIDLSVMGGTPPYNYLWSNNMNTEDLNNLSPGTYSITVTDANGCTISEMIPLSNIIVSMTSDTVVCDGDQLQLLVDAPTAVSYEWIPGDNLSCTDCPDPIYTADIFGPMTYLVNVEDATGCIEQDFLVIYVQSYLDFNLLQFSNSPVFQGDTLELYCNVGNAAVVDWTGPGNFASNECNPIVANANGGLEGMFSLMIEDEYGCEASATADVDILTIIDSIGEGGVICVGETYQLFVDAPNATSILWSPAATLDNPTIANPVANPTESTQYTVTVEDTNGNTDVATIFVAIDNVPVLNIVGPTEVCNGEDVIVCTDSGYPGTYTWEGPNGFFVTTPCFPLENFDETMSGCYQVTYTTPLGCITTAEICIDAIDFQIQSITDNIDICFDESAVLEVVASGAVTYQWIPEDYLDCTTCSVVTASPPQITTYLVIATDANGCQDEAFTVVNIDYECVWPGDTDTSKVVDNFDLLNIGLAYDSIGPIRDNATILWDGQMAQNWFVSQPGIDADFKHIDCNGDGFINADDTLAITQNWGEMHNFTGENNQTNFTVDPPFYVDPDTLIEGESISLPVILGEMDDPANGVYGIAFTLEYDSSVVVPGSAKMTFNNGWIGSKGVDMITIQKTFVSPGVIDVGMTRIDGEEMDGFGEIGQVNITIEDDILFRNGEDESRNGAVLEAIFNISNVKIINSLGEEIPVNPIETSAVVDATVGINSIPWNEFVQVQPNPANDAFFIISKNIDIESINLFAMTGELLLNQKPNGLKTQINIQHLQTGIYLLKVQTELGIMVERIVVKR